MTNTPKEKVKTARGRFPRIKDKERYVNTRRNFTVFEASKDDREAWKLQILILACKGMPTKEICTKMECTKRQYDEVMVEYKTKGHFRPLPRPGRPTIIGETSTMAIKQYVEMQPNASLRDIQDVIQGSGKDGGTPSKMTIARALRRIASEAEQS